LHDVERIAGLGLLDDGGAGGHLDLVELAGHARQVFPGQTREDRGARDGVDEVVHLTPAFAGAEDTRISARFLDPLPSPA
jgi:hypothetical protein